MTAVAGTDSPRTGRLRLTQTRSLIGRMRRHRHCVRGLGLRRIGHVVELADTAEIRGMVDKVGYLLRVEEI